jgi:hypothetical protein
MEARAILRAGALPAVGAVAHEVTASPCCPVEGPEPGLQGHKLLGLR